MRVITYFWLLCAVGGAARAQVLVSLGTSTNCSTLQGGQTCTLTARVTGATNTAVTWAFSPTVAGVSTGPPSGPDATGLTTNTYKAPTVVAARQVVTATATSVADPSQFASALITLQPVTVTVLVSPGSVTLVGGQTQQFTATVTGISQTGVTWSINPATGSIDPNSGLYTAPATITSSQKVTVTATSTFDTTVTGTATITLQPPATITVTVSPSTASLTNSATQQFTATVTNSTAGVTWSINPQTGTIDNTGLYTAPSLISTSSKVTVTATSTADTNRSGTATVTLNPIVDVGTGSPNGALQQAFISAFYRNGFNTLVSLPPLGNVKTLGSGYVQEFSDSSGGGAKLALVSASPTSGTPVGVVQLLANLYAYYTSVGAGTAGLPLMDTQNCPFFDPANSCEYDFFDKSYALFAYASALPTGQNFSIATTFYTEWTSLGGMNGPGRPVSAQTAITASTATTATVQTFASGAIYTINSGVNKGKIFGVIEPLYDLYVSQSGPSGSLGLPTAEVIQVSTGVYRQTFEGGALQYTSSGGPILQFPVASVQVGGPTVASNVTLSLGQTLTLSATVFDTHGTAVTDRPVSWASTNSKVVSIQASGFTAVLTAAGGGAASVTASAQGVTSAKFNVLVIAPCCQIGDGAPAAVAQAFQDALTRNKLTAQVPVPSAAARVGNGYVQMVQASGAGVSGQVMLAQSDSLGTAYVVAGAVLVRYLVLGGPAGALGYPIGDQSAGGTQLFAASAALAGNPVRLVSGGTLAKWSALGYETGTAGPPTSDAAAFSTFGADSGFAQSFGGGAIYAATAGPRAGQAYFVSGLILARYNALGGAAGDYGMPVSDEFVTGSVHQQNFEGGNFTYSAGDAAAVEHPAPKVPGVVVAPATISAGGRARLAIFGFANGSTIRVSVTGQADFLVTSANGAYSWDMAIPLGAKSGTVSIHAADTKGTAAADGTLAIKGFADNRLPLAKVQGDNQTGLPGALLPLPLIVALKDASGAPVVGAPVVFQASPGAVLSVSNTVTDSNGQAQTSVRLPAAEGVSAVTADAPSIAQTPASFYMRAAAASLANFPNLVQAGTTLLGNGTATIAQKGALLTAVASILRYHQNRAELGAPNGMADPSTLNQFLQAYCVADAKGVQLCDGFLSNPDSGEQVVNLWRAAEFTGGVDIAVQSPSTATIADLAAQGSPVLLSLGLSLNGSLAGGHYVVATGVAADGSIVIQDPSPVLARTNLNDYLKGFSGAAGAWKADLRGVVQFARRSHSATRFMAGALSQPVDLMKNLALGIQSAVGTCGTPLDLLDAVDPSATPGTPLLSRLNVCDGLQPVYQLAIGAPQRYRAFVTDLASAGSSVDVSGSAPATYQASRPQFALVLASQSASFTADGVVNAASFTSGIAPGGIMAIFGVGLAGPGASTAVDFDGESASVLSASPFQVNAIVPPDLAPGTHTLRITSAYGTAQQTVTVSTVAPAIFLVGSPAVGAVTNQDNSLNSPSNPLVRGQTLVVYATGLGAVVKQGQLSVTAVPVTVVLSGQELPVAFAGLTPGIPGLYQVNVAIPTATPPGLGISLTLKQGGQMSNIVSVTLQ